MKGWQGSRKSTQQCQIEKDFKTWVKRHTKIEEMKGS